MTALRSLVVGPGPFPDPSGAEAFASAPAALSGDCSPNPVSNTELDQGGRHMGSISTPVC